MNVDADSLEQLNLRTRDGAERAGTAFTEATGTETRIGVTRITLASQQDLSAALLADSEACIQFDLAGQLSGTVVLGFDEQIRTIIQAALTGIEATDNGPVVDLGVDLIGAFIEEWESAVDGELTVDAPTYVEDLEPYEFDLDAVSSDTESAPVFQSDIHVLGGPGQITLYFAPDAEAIGTLLGSEDVADEDFESFGMDDETTFEDDSAAVAFGEATDGGSVVEGTDNEGSSLFDAEPDTAPLPLDKLSVFSDLTREGTNKAAERVTGMTGIQTETEISGITFTPIDDISGELEGDSYVGTTTRFEGTPSGHLVILFRAGAAKRIAETMLPMDPDSEGLTSMHESALEELGNIMTSGFIDGWANVLQTSVEHTPPEFTDDMDMALLEIVTDQLGPFQTHAYTIESKIRIDEIEFDCEIHALPNEAELSAALDSLLVERRDQTEADPSDLF